MSLLSLNALRIYVAPSGLAAVARHRLGWGALRTAAWDNPAAPPVNWREVLPALQEMVRDLGGGKVDMILSGHFFRYQILPWQDGLQSYDEALACARYGLARTYGSEAESWPIALSDEPPGSASIAAGFDPELLACLKAAVTAGGGRLASIRPGLIVALNVWRRAVASAGATWFVVLESTLLTLVLIERGEWRWVRTRRAGADWRARLPELLADEALMSGQTLADAAVLVVCPEESGIDDLPEGAKLLSLADDMKRRGVAEGRAQFAWMA